MLIYGVILTGDNEVSLHAFLRLYFKRVLLVLLKTVSFHQPFLRMFLVLFSIFFLYLEAFQCYTTSDWQNCMVVLHSNTQNLEKKTNNVLENAW